MDQPKRNAAKPQRYQTTSSDEASQTTNAVFKNQYFVKPSRQEFQQHMKEALRAAKENVRSKSRGLRTSARKENVQYNFWNDKPDEDEDLTDEN
ncbi:uncharacterized protein LOC116853569 [Odontomachus brunneus]|uniref:uncharacterized protein LOC116853569 n=1 Tax=Odontomachus brunneus TaxID=486640 RepID=UPI0013F22066|nr:uncharacterized protein LOC116853569 [Odontomachus brunneus]